MITFDSPPSALHQDKREDYQKLGASVNQNEKGARDRTYPLPGHTDREAFFLFPVDPDTNNTKVYVINSALAEIRSG